MSIPILVPHHAEAAPSSYLLDVVGTLLNIEMAVGGEPFSPTVDHLGDALYRITFQSGGALVVDEPRRTVDDPCHALPECFSGLLPTTRRYRLVWRDQAGVPNEATVLASSRRSARAFAGAPDNAYIERR